MFPIYLYDEKNMPEDDICYIIAKQGIFLKKKMGLVESLTKVDKISILKEIKPWAKMNLPKISGSQAAKILSFFKVIVNTISGEANVLLYYSKDKNNYKIIVPVQEVSSGGCDYEIEGTNIPEYNLVGTIHSHARMSAFHSGTDDKDEKHFDGLHITFGNLDDDYPSISASIVINGFRVIVDPCDYIDKCVEVSNEKVTHTYYPRKIYKYVNGKMILDEKRSKVFSSEFKKYDKRYDVQVSEHQRIFNKNWLKKVTKKIYKTYSGEDRMKALYNYQNDDLNNFFTSGYDSLTEWLINKRKDLDKGTLLNVGPVKEGIEFPDHELDDEYNPCRDCVFKDYKLEYAYEILESGVDPDEFISDTNNFISNDGTRDHMEADSGELSNDKTPEELIEEQYKSEEFLHPSNNVMIPQPENNPTTPFSKLTTFIKDKLSS